MTILRGIRVVEFTHMVAGPACGQVLADLGAEVVKVEPPGGDITRRLGPGNDTVSALFAGTNRSKTSLCLDLRDPGDATRARSLALGADVVITNVDADMLEKAGLSPGTLRASNPALIVAELTAFGPGGPLGTDGIAQATMGLMDLTGEPGGARFRTGPSVVDVSTGVWAALGILAALERRRMTGRGDRLSVSLADVCLYMQYSQVALHSAAPELVRRNGNHSMISCTPVLDAADGQVIVTILHDRHWTVFCGLLDRADLARPRRPRHERAALQRPAGDRAPAEPGLPRQAASRLGYPTAGQAHPLRAGADLRGGDVRPRSAGAGDAVPARQPRRRDDPPSPHARRVRGVHPRAAATAPGTRRRSARGFGQFGRMSGARFGLDAYERSLLALSQRMSQQVGRPGDRPLSREELLAAFAALAPSGYLASTLPGGAGALRFAALVEGLSPTLPLLGNHSVQRYLHAFGSQEQKETVLSDLLSGRAIAAIAITEPDAGGDLGRISTAAVHSKGGYILNGRKTWVTHGMVADYYVVLAATAAGPTRFLVLAGAAGLSRRPLQPTGLRHLTFAELEFVDCSVPSDGRLGEEGQGNAGAKAAFPIARALAALQAIRLGEAALEMAVEFARTRIIFGQRLSTSAEVQDNLAALQGCLSAARLLAYRCMLELDGRSVVGMASSAKALACEGALNACRWTLDLLGSTSLTQSHASLDLVRDARMMAVVDGTTVLNRLATARRIFADP